MQTSETFATAREKAREIVERRGADSRARVVGVSGAVAGRENNPDVFYGHAVRYSAPMNGDECIMYWPSTAIGTVIRDPERSLYIVDSVGMYVAGWQGQGDGTANRAPDGPIYLHPIGPHNMPVLPRRAYVFRTNVIPALKGADY